MIERQRNAKKKTTIELPSEQYFYLKEKVLELQKLIRQFRHYLKEWQQRGLERIEVTRKPELAETEYKNERRREWLEQHGSDYGDKIAQLTLM